MNISELQWFLLQSPATPDEIIVVEKTLGIQFPSDYLNVARIYHGAYPIGWHFHAFNPDGGNATSSLAVVLSFTENEYHTDILSKNRSIYLPDHLIVIGKDGGAGHICLDYRANKTNPKVVFYVPNDPPLIIYTIAENFTDFMSKSFKSV